MKAEQVLWRYMRFAECVNQLVEQDMIFASAAIFNDHREGLLPRRTIEARRERIRDHLSERGLKEDAAITESHFEFMRHRTFITRWNMQNHESFVMWRAYVGNEHGLAIQTTVGKLKECLPKDDKIC